MAGPQELLDTTAMALAITPIDGRYREDVDDLSNIVSEFALMRYRATAMAYWMILLGREGIASYDVDVETILLRAIKNFSITDYLRIKEIEKTSDHDVKAVEYWLREQLPESVWQWIHFACTSEDVNNVAYAFMVRDAIAECDKTINAVIEDLVEKALSWRAVSMLSLTHGQSATPSKVGKEVAVFVRRLRKRQCQMNKIKVAAKWNGATGNYAAHVVAFPDVDWPRISRSFIEKFGFEWNPLTTQIENHDTQVQILNEVGQICSICVDLCSDVWTYVSIEYFGQEMKADETGSSTMPGKINPIKFENARTNFKVARALARLMAEELPVSTLQRDLSDSSMQRQFGPMFGHFLLALKNVKKGLGRIVLRPDRLQTALERNPGVLGEAIQTVMRKHGHADAYEQLKAFQRGREVSLDGFRAFIAELDIPEDDRDRLLALEPADYVGLSSDLVDHMDLAA